MNVSFAHLWQQPEFSDVEVLLTADLQQQQDGHGQQHTDQQQNAQAQRLTSFPGHSAILSNSAFIKAQILRWQHKRTRAEQDAPGDPTADEATSSNGAQDSSSSNKAKPQLVLTLQDASEQPAAVAVLAALYVAKPLPELLSELTQEQQLQAALLADMWQVQEVSAAAARALCEAALQDGLSEAAARQLLHMQGVSECMQPLLQLVVLSKFGDLEAVWADGDLRSALLQLSLPAMELLLSSDELKAASEDTVMYTARMYYVGQNKSNTPEQRDAIADRLAPTIRCQHLSPYWLAASAMSLSNCVRVLGNLQPQLQRLLMLQTVQPGLLTGSPKSASTLQEILPSAPSSWALGRRVARPVSSVELHWKLDISALREAAQLCAAQRRNVILTAPDHSPPLGGIDFKCEIRCKWDTGLGGCLIGLVSGPHHAPSQAFCSVRGTVAVLVSGAEQITFAKSSAAISCDSTRGLRDIFGLGAVVQGWDEATWVAKGFPATGQLVVRLTVTSVAHDKIILGVSTA